MAESGETLEKSLGLLDVYALAAGATLSAGFFILPGLAAEQAGPALVLAYVLAAVPLVPAILSKVELMTAMPRSGGIYYFLDRSLGPVAGTIGGVGTWLTLLLKVCFALVGMGAYLDLFLPQVNIVPVAVGLAVVVGGVNIYGAEITGRIQIALLAVILAVLAAFVGGGVFHVEAARFHDFFGEGAESLVATTGLVYVSYAGLTKIAGIAEEVREPERNLPLGVLLSLATALVVYAAGTAVIVGVTPMGDLQGSLTPVADAAAAMGGRWAMVGVSVAALFAFTAVTNAGTMSASRYPLAMSRDRILPAGLKKLNRRGIPGRAVALTVGTMILVIVLLDPLRIAKLASAFKLFVFALVCLSVVVMRESRIEEYDPGYRTPFYPWLQVVGILAPFVLIATMGWLALTFSVGLVVLGLAWYRIYVRGKTDRGGAMYHIFERLGKRRFEGLEHELQGILHRRDATELDPYRHVVGRAQVLDLEGRPTLEEAMDRASRRLGELLPVGPDDLTETLLEETELGLTPISHGLALPHVRLREVTVHHLLIVRARQGIEFAGDRVMRVPVEAGREPQDEEVHGLLVLVSPTEHPEEHLQILARLAGHARSVEFLDDWLDAEGEAGLKRLLLRGERIEVLRVSDSGPTADLCGRSLEEVSLPAGVVVTLIRRNGEALVPSGATRLREGDVATLVGSEDGIRRLRRRLELD